ncbi:MAG: Rrf2 family transcriptional regulator [Sporocytophaga sp.]|uniref:RrF2 family transcriptional regulator n=1 Tax=Sporocytophaga sp. TaxID=2231183 RepID=UPI001B2397D5|nr:Rrf2 family transcriptional regulator [Sporocytophaga sp.]MBO9699852.1 Rrf2 family transcriptional regulator [Sporocytophaga sp.]
MLSKKTRYAIKALTKLAKEFQKGPILISDISKTERIPQKFLEAILLELKNAGILNSKKGKGGGYYLIKKPEEVDLANIIRLFDGAIALLPCVSIKYYERCDECVDETLCGFRDIIREVRDNTLKILKESTLQDIIQREDSLKV